MCRNFFFLDRNILCLGKIMKKDVPQENQQRFVLFAYSFIELRPFYLIKKICE